MNKIIQIAKYQVSDHKTSLFIFYAVILALALLMLVVNTSPAQGNYGYNEGGAQLSVGINSGGGYSNLTSASIIFIFIVGLNSFKTAYFFMQANNVSRKVFYVGNFVSFLLLAGIMTIVDTTLNQVFQGLIAHKTSLEQIYNLHSFWVDIPFTFTFLTLAICLGWLITLLYYRSDKIMKIILSVSPFLLIILSTYINRITNGAITRELGKFFDNVLGISAVSPINAVFSFAISAALIYGLSFLLVRKAPIKL